MDLPSDMFSLVKQTEGEGYSAARLPLPHPNDDEVLIKVTKVNYQITFNSVVDVLLFM